MNAAKAEAVEVIKNLPDDTTFETSSTTFTFWRSLSGGQQRLVAEGGLSQDEMERDLGKWILS